MSSPESEKVIDADKLSGHAPASKVGGMRVRTRSKGDSGSEKITTEELRKQEEEFGTEIQTVTAGSLVQGKKAFPTEAIKSYHEKPHPSHEKPTKPVIQIIHQPRN